MRNALLATMLLLSACAGKEGPRLGAGEPGVNVAQAALAAGAPQIALHVADAILAKHPDDRAALENQAEALVALGRSDEAETSYTKLLQQDPQSVPALIGFGRLRLRSHPEQARQLFQAALAREPRNTIALNDLGIALDLLGDHAAAQTEYRHVLGLDPRSQAAEVNLALSMALSGRAAEAAVMLKPYAADPAATPRIRHDLAAAMALAGDKEGAARILRADMAPDEVERALRAYESIAP
jgi:Flp pilus assembly protein TadD